VPPPGFAPLWFFLSLAEGFFIRFQSLSGSFSTTAVPAGIAEFFPRPQLSFLSFFSLVFFLPTLSLLSSWFTPSVRAPLPRPFLFWLALAGRVLFFPPPLLFGRGCHYCFWAFRQHVMSAVAICSLFCFWGLGLLSVVFSLFQRLPVPPPPRCVSGPNSGISPPNP